MIVHGQFEGLVTHATDTIVILFRGQVLTCSFAELDDLEKLVYSMQCAKLLNVQCDGYGNRPAGNQKPKSTQEAKTA